MRHFFDSLTPTASLLLRIRVIPGIRLWKYDICIYGEGKKRRKYRMSIASKLFLLFCVGSGVSIPGNAAATRRNN